MPATDIGTHSVLYELAERPESRSCRLDSEHRTACRLPNERVESQESKAVSDLSMQILIDTVHVAVIQAAPELFDMQASPCKLSERIGDAARQGLVVSPEAFIGKLMSTPMERVRWGRFPAAGRGDTARSDRLGDLPGKRHAPAAQQCTRGASNPTAPSRLTTVKPGFRPLGTLPLKGAVSSRRHASFSETPTFPAATLLAVSRRQKMS